MKKAFTLVELIVVVSILAILGTIGFVSYNGYLSGVRDTNRTSQLTSLHDGLELYKIKKDLPMPDNGVEIKNGTELLGYQGYVGTGVLNQIEFLKGGKDPKDGTYFTYYLDNTKRQFQLLTYLEEEENISYLLGRVIEKAEANVDYTYRYPVVYGKKLGILLDNITNAPIQETLTGTLNLGSGTGSSTTYKAYFKNDNVVTSSGTTLVTKIKENRTALAGSGSVVSSSPWPETLKHSCVTGRTIDGTGANGNWKFASYNDCGTSSWLNHTGYVVIECVDGGTYAKGKAWRVEASKACGGRHRTSGANWQFFDNGVKISEGTNAQFQNSCSDPSDNFYTTTTNCTSGNCWGAISFGQAVIPPLSPNSWYDNIEYKCNSWKFYY